MLVTHLIQESMDEVQRPKAVKLVSLPWMIKQPINNHPLRSYSPLGMISFYEQ